PDAGGDAAERGGDPGDRRARLLPAALAPRRAAAGADPLLGGGLGRGPVRPREGRLPSAATRPGGEALRRGVALLPVRAHDARPDHLVARAGPAGAPRRGGRPRGAARPRGGDPAADGD